MSSARKGIIDYAKKYKEFWDRKENVREYFLHLAERYRIASFDAWYDSLSIKFLSYNGGGHILRKYKSPVYAIMDAFPEHKWKIWKFTKVPRHFWNDIKIQREFLEEFSKHMNFQNKEDWYKISSKDIRNFGGRGLLHVHKDSIYTLLTTAYPEYNWQVWKFKQAPRNFWDDDKNCITALNQTKIELDIFEDQDWLNLKTSLLDEKVGEAFKRKFGGFIPMLKRFFPELSIKLDEHHSKVGSKAQLAMFLILKKTFPNNDVLVDYPHPSLTFSSGVNMELDIFIPELSLAFEYQGEQHYKDGLYSTSKLEERDREKKKACKNNNIILIEVPYWWDMRKDSLLSLVKKNCPNLQFPT